MKREDAIARHGHHFVISTHSRTVYEALGPAPNDEDDDEETPRTLAEAEDELRMRMADLAMARIAKIDSIFNRTANRVAIFLAERGWHRRADSIREATQKLRAEREALMNDIENDFEGRTTVKPLPDTLKIPAELPIGHVIHIVRYTHAEDGLQHYTATVTDRKLWPGSMARGDWDYYFAYGATDEKGGRLSFEYNHADHSQTEIKNNYHGIRYFLTREAAEDHILDLSARLSARFAAVAIEQRLRRIDRAREERNNPAPRP